ncbi:hypothetical protein [Nocardia sp. NPDC005366]|uniref:hypothetical protein n=1 Tax=Nocardia sp. NPDC005366 TaxID=3156878 RepID=UPI0033B3B860
MNARPESGLGFARGTGPPRSSLWRGILGAAPVVSSAVVLELGRDLVVGSFGDTEVVKALAAALRSLAVLVVLGGILFAAIRWSARRRESTRTAAELDVLAGLDEPGTTVAGLPAPVPAPTPTEEPGLVSPEAAVLRELPVRDYRSAALLAVLAAIVAAPARLPQSGTPPRFDSANDLLAHLLTRGILIDIDPHRYCVAKKPTTPPLAEVVAGPAWPAAVWTLLHHYADRAGAWAAATESVRHAEAADRWFTMSAPILHQLVMDCSATEYAQNLPESALPELVGIIDALEVWYTRTGTADAVGFRALCAAAADMPRMSNLAMHHDLLEVRAGRRTRAPHGYRPMRWATGVAVRWEHDVALRALAEPSPDLAAVADRLERAWWLLPRADVGAEVCALINLAVVGLRRGRLEAAQDRLDLVFAHTADGRELGGRCHAHEIMGVVCWARGEPFRALRSWQTALTGYRSLADRRGTGRCLRHLGSALVVAPEHGAIVLGADPPPDRGQVLLQASGWLAAADRWNPVDPASALAAEDYRGRVSAELAPTAPLTSVERWPLAVADPDLET